MSETATSAFKKELAELKSHARNLMELNPQIVFITDAGGQLCEIGESWLGWAGFTRDEALGLGWTAALHPDDHAPTLAMWQRCLRTGERFDMEYRLRRAAGGYVWFRARAVPQRDESGTIVRWYGTAEDIDERKSIDEALRASEAFSRSILKSSPDAIMVVDHEGHLEFINERGQSAFEIPVLGQVKGKPWQNLWPENAAEAASEALARALAGTEARFSTFRQQPGSLRTWWDVSVSSLETRVAGPPKVLAIARDVTEAKRVEKKLEGAARTDSLTRLANREVFRQALAAALADEVEASILFIDLDQFKAVNDVLGHLSGDELLKQAAVRLNGCVRRGDLVARLGGDEFAVLLLDAPGDAIRQMAARMIESLSKPYDLDGRLATISACIGIASLDATSVDEVLKQADIALYAAKADQSGTYRVYEEVLGRAVAERHALAMELRGALSRQEFALEYQGIVRSGSPGFTGFEALLRWHHPVHGNVPPSVFIPLLEQTGAIGSVGEWVLERACRDAAMWPEPITVAVNISTVQLRSGELVAQVSRSLERSGLKPERLQLEMTESVLLDNSDSNLEALKQLRMLGVELVLDDFGTGYSSLSYLRRFTFDKIKIDRAFVADMLSVHSSAAIITTIVSLAENLRVAMTAEGVETEEQHQELCRLGCNEFQGYLFSRPAPASRINLRPH